MSDNFDCYVMIEIPTYLYIIGKLVRKSIFGPTMYECNILMVRTVAQRPFLFFYTYGFGQAF